jgi:hypothetical protein
VQAVVLGRGSRRPPDPALGSLRDDVHEVARTTDLSAAG